MDSPVLIDELANAGSDERAAVALHQKIS